MRLLHWGPVAPEKPGKLQYVEVNMGTNHGTRGMVIIKYTQKLGNIMLFDNKKYHERQECVGGCIQMKGKRKVRT